MPLLIIYDIDRLTSSTDNQKRRHGGENNGNDRILLDCFIFAFHIFLIIIQSNDFDANPRRLTWLVKHGEPQVQSCKHVSKY